MNNCIDIARPFYEAVAEEHIPTQTLGGIATAALKLPATHIEETDIYAPADMVISRLREKNPSPRDMDINTLSTDPAVVARVEAIGALTIGEAMEVNVFGVHHLAELDDMKANPLANGARYASVSDRYIPTNTVAELMTGTASSYMKAVFPFGAEVPKEALQTWQLHIGNHTHIEVPHPAVTILNCLTRSIGGPRRKYDDAVPTMFENVKNADPQLIDWMISGPGRSHLELAAVLRTVGSRHLRARPVTIGNELTVASPRFRDLRDHPMFLLRDAPPKLQIEALALAKTRGIIVGTIEDHLMDIWEEKGFERFFKGIVRNNSHSTELRPTS